MGCSRPRRRRVAGSAPGGVVLEAALALGVGQQRDPLGGGAEQDPLACQARADRERDGQMGLAGSWRAEQDHVLLGVQEVELSKMLDHLLLDRALEGEVELLQRLSRRETSGSDAALAAVGLASRGLGG